MMFSTCRQTFSQRALYGEIATRFWFQMSVVNFHLHNTHKFDLACQFLNLLLENFNGKGKLMVFLYWGIKFRKMIHKTGGE